MISPVEALDRISPHYNRRQERGQFAAAKARHDDAHRSDRDTQVTNCTGAGKICPIDNHLCLFPQ
jgi:hypothetical protein